MCDWVGVGCASIGAGMLDVRVVVLWEEGGLGSALLSWTCVTQQLRKESCTPQASTVAVMSTQLTCFPPALHSAN